MSFYGCDYYAQLPDCVEYFLRNIPKVSTRQTIEGWHDIIILNLFGIDALGAKL